VTYKSARQEGKDSREKAGSKAEGWREIQRERKLDGVLWFSFVAFRKWAKCKDFYILKGK
jgi:hypothetical protein